jgi:hypothetical protein
VIAWLRYGRDLERARSEQLEQATHAEYSLTAFRAPHEVDRRDTTAMQSTPMKLPVYGTTPMPADNGRSARANGADAIQETPARADGLSTVDEPTPLVNNQHGNARFHPDAGDDNSPRARAPTPMGVGRVDYSLLNSPASPIKTQKEGKMNTDMSGQLSLSSLLIHPSEMQVECVFSKASAHS